jgi:ABC-type cobalamin transport system permease subunit
MAAQGTTRRRHHPGPLLLAGVAVGLLATAVTWLLTTSPDAALIVGLLHAAVTWTGLACCPSDHPEET